ncbi:MAG: TatD family hydrolase [Candidatus Pacearchaeota archaeon]|nr:MAG: TatD family hydrolase [Candidatus Pacearchaeota archaeon]
MIDCHCHFEQKEYDKDRNKIIEKCKKQLKAIITSSAHPKDIKLTLELTKKYPNFIFAAIGLHPTYIKELTEEQINKTIEAIKNNKDKIVAVGEIGLDYFWIKEEEWQEKQRQLFKKMIKIVKELGLPLVIHSRNAREDTIKILEEEGMKRKKVLMHLFTDRKNLQRVIDNGWFVSIGPGIKRSKNLRKIARDTPLNKILLETDSPWFAQENQKYGTPLNIKIAAKKIAEIKKLTIEQVEKQTDLNAIEFFNLEW